MSLQQRLCGWFGQLGPPAPAAVARSQLGPPAPAAVARSQLGPPAPAAVARSQLGPPAPAAVARSQLGPPAPAAVARSQLGPPAPAAVARSQRDVTLAWRPPGRGFAFLRPTDLLYRLQRRDKIPPWTTVYCGSKTQRTIDNLAPGQAHVFRLQVLVKSTSVPMLGARARQHYGSELAVYREFGYNPKGEVEATGDRNDEESTEERKAEATLIEDEEKCQVNGHSETVEIGDGTSDSGDGAPADTQITTTEQRVGLPPRPWLESRWSEACWCSTEPQGASVVCFCMAVRCGHIKQVQQMLDERPELIEIINSIDGLTPLITAINKGQLSTVKVLLAAGAAPDAAAAAGQRPLLLALLAARLDLAAALLERGADISARDRNRLRAEHYAVDSGRVEVVVWILERGGELEVKDNQGWTPLFRAVSQGACSELVAELLRRGADGTVVDHAGLAIADVARLVRDRRGDPRGSLARLVDPGYPHERALHHFTRLTKKIHSVQTVFK